MPADTPRPRPNVTGVTSVPDAVVVDVLIVPVFGPDDDLSDLPDVDAATSGELGRARAGGAFKAELFDVFVTPAIGGWKAGALVFVGAGDPAEASALRIRRVAAVGSYAARDRAAGSVGMIVRRVPDVTHGVQMCADGLATAEFEIGNYKDGADGKAWTPSAFTLVAPGGEAGAVAEAARRGRIVGEAANVSRSLANEPGNLLPPRVFADRVAAEAASVGLSVDVLDRDRIEALGMGLVLGVAQGSAEPPRVVVLRHEPDGAPEAPVVGLIGKGVTFDTGGISLKPPASMDRMKYDMSGGAAVAGAMLAIARLKCPFRVVAVIPMVENMPGGGAIRPGDVLTAASGRTVEITNTDAEGRLILGDALWYAGELGATHLVDVATLTGAVVIALGRWTNGLLGQDEDWIAGVQEAGDRGGDRVWRLPLYEEAAEQMHSDIADTINAAGREGGGGTVTAASFLQAFTGDRPWAHLDIAGTAWADRPAPHQRRGPTGSAVRLLTELAMTGGRPRSG